AIGPAELDEFLATEGDDAGTAVAASQIDLGLVEELHRLMPWRNKKGGMRRIPPNSDRPSGRGLRLRLHRDEHAVVRSATEADASFDKREEGMVATHADIVAGMVLGAPLADQDVAREHRLVAEPLDS